MGKGLLRSVKGLFLGRAANGHKNQASSFEVKDDPAKAKAKRACMCPSLP